MKIIGLLSWYDEPPATLAASITGLARAGVEHVVCLDGAYALYPDAKPASPTEQAVAIHMICDKLGIGCTVHTPHRVWDGNETQKRTALFALGWAVAEPGDWFWVQDADMVTTKAPEDLKARLEATEHDAAEVEILDVVAQRAKRLDWPERFDMRSLFRAQPISVVTNHITYMADDGRLLWGWDGGERPIVPALDLTDLVEVEHRPDERPAARQVAKMCYYAERDQAGIERGVCSCGKPAVRLVATKWRKSSIGPVADWAESCEVCAEKRERVGRRQLLQLGVDPDRVAVENRNGQAPVVA